MQFSVSNAELTQKIAEKLAKALHAGDVILLDGDLGAGKTTFTKGLARGLGIRKNVKSPTFTLIREYHEGRLPLYHMDVYRLEETGGDDLGLEEYFNGDGVSVVEWSQFVEDDLPKEFLIVHFIKDETDDDKRTLVFEPRGKRYEEAMQELDGFIDQALLNNMAQVDIIHGIGTGVIREGVTKYLRRNKHVKSFEYAPQNAGGSGATIVTFKG